jgi:hypothetical protein
MGGEARGRERREVERGKERKGGEWGREEGRERKTKRGSRERKKERGEDRESVCVCDNEEREGGIEGGRGRGRRYTGG